MNSGENKTPLTSRQHKKYDAKNNDKGIRITLSAKAISDIPITGGKLPLLAALPGLKAAASASVAKGAALGAVGTVSGMALEKAVSGNILELGKQMKKIKTFWVNLPLSNFSLID